MDIVIKCCGVNDQCGFVRSERLCGVQVILYTGYCDQMELWCNVLSDFINSKWLSSCTVIKEVLLMG